MKIRLKPSVFLRLEAATVLTEGLEFSGFGFVEIKKEGEEKIFEVYEVVVLDVGSQGFTEIDATKILPLLDRPDAKQMKLWFHRHPMGNDTPGPHNWSGTDEHTATKEPLGGIPETVKWALSIVRTPRTWVGRIDRFKDGEVKTNHLPVTYCTDEPFMQNITALKNEYLAKAAEKAAVQVRDYEQWQSAWQGWELERASSATPLFARLLNRFISAVRSLGKTRG
jgi:hypothetical protein